MTKYILLYSDLSVEAQMEPQTEPSKFIQPHCVACDASTGDVHHYTAISGVEFRTWPDAEKIVAEISKDKLVLFESRFERTPIERQIAKLSAQEKERVITAHNRHYGQPPRPPECQPVFTGDSPAA